MGNRLCLPVAESVGIFSIVATMRSRKSVQPLPRRMRARCFFCGGQGETRDHVPPRGFFLEPLPENLTTLPSCTTCNQQLGRDEEYLLAAISYCSLSPVIQTRLVPGGDLHKPSLLNRIADSSYADGGMSFVAPEMERVERVVKKLVIGLYCRRYGTLVPPSSIADVRAWHQMFYPAWAHPQALTERFERKSWEAIQRGVFEFIIVEDLEEPGYIRCLMNLYQTICAEAACPRPTRSMKEIPCGQRLFDGDEAEEVIGFLRGQ